MTLELEVLADHPRCYFPLTETGEGAGDVYVDATGHGYDVAVFLRAHLLTHVAGPLAGTTAPHFGLDGDGHADALRSTVTAGLPTDGIPFTVEGWVRTASRYLVGPLIAWGPVGGYPDISLDVYSLAHSFDPTGPSFFVEDGTADNYGAATTPQLFDDQWHHLVITDDGAGGKSYYRDGTLVLSVALEGGGNGLTYSGANILCLGDTGQYGDCVLGNTFGDAAMAHVAAYDVVLAAERVQCHWRAGNGLPCAEWVRLAHVSGQGYWQSKGDVTEEWAGGARRVLLPYPTLAGTPDLLMGKDPATGVPAFCPPPPVVAITPAPAPAPPTPVDPDQFRCNIAQYVANQMELAYGVAAAKITSLDRAEVTLIAAGGALASVILGLLDVVFPPLMILTVFAIPFIVSLATYQETASLLPLGGPAVEALAHALYCALRPSADGTYNIDGTTLFNWSYNLTSFASSFSGDQLAEVRTLITVYQIEYWHNLALQAGATGSTVCVGYDCTGLLP